MAATMKALRQLEYAQPLQVVDIPIPQVAPGNAIIRILAASIISYTKNIYNGARKYPYPTPLTTGTSAIGRIHDLPPDSTALSKDQLVLIDITVRSRDDPTHVFLSAIHEGYSEGSKKLMRYWADGSCAEYMSVQLECVYPLNESVLLKSHGYTVRDLLYIPKLLIPYGGLADIGLKPGETVIVAPATGGFGGAAVHVALSMGARVIAMGRNESALARLASTFGKLYPEGRLATVPFKNDSDPQELEKDLMNASQGFPVDVFFDIAPPEGSKSPHFKASILALRHGGRVSLMGGQREDVPLPMSKVMHFNLSLRGKWMFERQDVRDLIGLVEKGIMLIGGKGGLESDAKAFKLEEWAEAFDSAFEYTGSVTGAFFNISD